MFEQAARNDGEESQLNNVFYHKVEQKAEQEEELEKQQEVKSPAQDVIKEDEQERAEPSFKRPVIELPEFSPFSDSEKKEEIKFHRSPRNVDNLEFAQKLNQAKSNKASSRPDQTLNSQPQSVERIIGNIPKEFFRIENKFESIDAVLDHIDKKRENFMASVTSSPNAGGLSKTIEPIVNSVSPQARNALKKFSTLEANDQASKEQANITVQSNHKASSAKHSRSVSQIAKSERADPVDEPSPKNEEKQSIFETANNQNEQGAGNIFTPDNEIINFETNEHPEFKGT